MIKNNIRERAANKLNLFVLILEILTEGNPVSVEMSQKARRDVREIMAWIDKKEFQTEIRKKASNKLNLFDSLLGECIEEKPVSLEAVKKAQSDVKEIMLWLDKREYKTS